jgi:hypothetical protein
LQLEFCSGLIFQFVDEENPGFVVPLASWQKVDFFIISEIMVFVQPQVLATRLKLIQYFDVGLTYPQTHVCCTALPLFFGITR